MFYKTKNIYEQYTYSNQEFIDNKCVVFLWRRGSMKYGIDLNDLLGLHFLWHLILILPVDYLYVYAWRFPAYLF